MMQDQLDRSREETKGIREMKAKAEGILEGLSEARPVDSGSEGQKQKKSEEVVGEGKDIWEELEREFGAV